MKRCATLRDLDIFQAPIPCLSTLCATSSQLTPFVSAVGARMKNELPLGACLPLPPIIIMMLMHLNRFLRHCLSIVDGHLILASPSYHPTRVQLWVNVLSLKWTLLTILYVSVSARVLEVRAQGLRVSKSGAEELLGG